MTVNKNWTLYQLDLNNAFLYGSLDRKVFMTLPQGYHTHGNNRVCTLLKSLSGLKQAPQKWNEILFGVLFEFGFIQSVNDYSLFVRIKGETILCY